MNATEPYDVVVVGSGPNGLAAAIELARRQRSVLVLEAADSLGGGTRSAELTLPGYTHDVCAAVLPLTLGSPFLSSLPLRELGCELVQPPIPLAHPFDDGSAVVLHRSIDETASGLASDGAAYARLFGPLVQNWQPLIDHLLGPFRWPRHPLLLAGFGVVGLLPATSVARLAFRGQRARALFAGLGAHSILPLERPVSAAFGLVLGLLGHAVGYPIVRGGTQRLAEAMARYLASLGGETRTTCTVERLSELPPHRLALLDLTPRQILAVAGSALSETYRRQLGRFRYGPGVFKVDWALDGPIPWTASECGQASTVHLGGTFEEVVAAEGAVGRGEHPARPFVILAQQTPFDPTRAPAGRHTAWGYCHVPNDSRTDMTRAIEAQIERFAPGFSGRILARSTRDTAQMEAYNANYVGGDINGGVQDLGQLWTRPVVRRSPYATTDPRVFICSSSTPPGGGVHGMCGLHAARAAASRLR